VTYCNTDELDAGGHAGGADVDQFAVGVVATKTEVAVSSLATIASSMSVLLRERTFGEQCCEHPRCTR
jgi:hypothetical protein